MYIKQKLFLVGMVMCAFALGGCKSPGSSWEIYESSLDPMDGTIIESSDFGENALGARWQGGEEHSGKFEPIYFNYDSALITPPERDKIELVAADLEADDTVALILEGHCDERGSREYNLALGESRALAVREYLVQLGISPKRIQTKSYGEERPAVEGHTKEAWSRNRRVNFVLYY